jgi:hypothetical protein
MSNNKRASVNEPGINCQFVRDPETYLLRPKLSNAILSSEAEASAFALPCPNH